MASRVRGRRFAGWRAVAVGAGVVVAAAACGSGGGGNSNQTSAGSSIPKGPIKIGALLTLTGPVAAIGTSQKTNDEALVNALNKKGGIAGHKIKLIILNDQANPTTAVAGARKLVADHVAGVIYAGTEATITQTVPVFMKAHVPVVTLDPKDKWANGKRWPYFFDNYPLNQPTTNVMAKFAKKRLHLSSVGVLGDSSPFFDDLNADFVKSAKAAGLPIAKTTSYASDATNVTAQVRQLKDAGVKGIVMLTASGMGHVYDALSTIGWHPPIITTTASFFDGYDSIGAFGKTSFSNCAVALPKGGKPDSGTAAVLKTVTAKTGVNPSVGQVVLTNDDFLILKAAIEQTHSLDPNKIKAAIEGFHDKAFTSPRYRYTFSATDHGGWPESEIHMCAMKPLGPFDLPYISD